LGVQRDLAAQVLGQALQRLNGRGPEGQGIAWVLRQVHGQHRLLTAPMVETIARNVVAISKCELENRSSMPPSGLEKFCEIVDASKKGAGAPAATTAAANGLTPRGARPPRPRHPQAPAARRVVPECGPRRQGHPEPARLPAQGRAL